MRTIVISLILSFLVTSVAVGQDEDYSVTEAERLQFQAIGDSAASDLLQAFIEAKSQLDTSATEALLKIQSNGNECGIALIQTAHEYVKAEMFDYVAVSLRFWRERDVVDYILNTNLEKMENMGNRLLLLGAKANSDIDAESYVFFGKALLEIRSKLKSRGDKWFEFFNDLAQEVSERNKKDTTKNPFDNR